MEQQEILHAMTLARLCRFSPATATQLYRQAGSATAVMQHRHDIKALIPDATKHLTSIFLHADEELRRAEQELQYDQQKGILPLVMNDERYPVRLKECDDAPIILYYKGTANLNHRHVISIVGTRHCTTYGQELVQRFVSDLRHLCPQTLIVSGLAYGIDVCAHRQALTNAFDTVGVLAHGLDELYPSHHRQTANEMARQGGLITEFMTQTRPEKMNFVQRNRIVASMSDACIVVESAEKGGSLITATIARSYDRDVFAFPGRVADKASAGCNQLIQDNVAGLITSAEDFVKAMRWESDKQLQEAQSNGIERQLFPEFSDDELRIVEVLKKTNDLQINILAVQCGMPVSRLSATLFELEMKGVVKTLAGGTYHLMALR